MGTRISRRIFYKILRALPGRAAAFVTNTVLYCKGNGTRFSYYKDSGLYNVTDDQGRSKVFFNPRRGFEIYLGGIKNRCVSLATSYGVDTVSFKEGDIVIDCGANYGDLLEYFTKDVTVQYIAFEPGLDEAATIRENYSSARVMELGLSDSCENKTFYLSRDSADSSLVEPLNYTDKTEIRTITLDNFCTENSIDRIRLLKVEAEGWEPEVLVGATDSLEFTDYVAVDVGFERGVECDETLTRVANLLFRRGFEMTYFGAKPVRVLFKRQGI